jgi:hypothetical protein
MRAARRGPSSPAARRAAATLASPLPLPERPRMRLVAWKPMRKGDLIGFATVELPIGLKLIDCPVLIGPRGRWASLPSKPQIDRDGRQKTDTNGRAVYAPVLEWRDRGLADRFSAAVVELVLQAHPEALPT